MDSVADADIASRLDPALHSLELPRTDLALPLIAAVRDALNKRRWETAAQLDARGVEISEEIVAGSISVRIYRGSRSPAPAVIYCHAGAFVLGNLDTDHRQCVELARRARCTVVSVDYRLAPEHPYPAALDDVKASLNWVADNATKLGVDGGRLAVAGSSAGAALAAAMAQGCADGSLPPVVYQLLHQPVLDDRWTPSKAEFGSTPGFDGPATELMWRHYLAGSAPTDRAAPGRRWDLANLPAAFIACSELDPLRDEAIGYALRLTRAGVATELHLFPGTCHGFDSLLPEWSVSQQLFELQALALRRALQVGAR